MAEVVRDRDDPQCWRVEYIDADGAVEVAIFSGPRAELRARQFSASFYEECG